MVEARRNWIGRAGAAALNVGARQDEYVASPQRRKDAEISAEKSKGEKLISNRSLTVAALIGARNFERRPIFASFRRLKGGGSQDWLPHKGK